MNKQKQIEACVEMMGFVIERPFIQKPFWYITKDGERYCQVKDYNPLTNPAQALELLENGVRRWSISGNEDGYDVYVQDEREIWGDYPQATNRNFCAAVAEAVLRAKGLWNED